jgi:hypothetical protein
MLKAESSKLNGKGERQKVIESIGKNKLKAEG